ncbi:MAG: cAMP-binding protein [Spirochaetaceae bacterium]|nr:MAG: cAMP-binding protein [Spirochaetaceae bacterium]
MGSPLQLSIVNFPQNAYIIVEGKADANCFYIIRSGKVAVSKEVEVVQEEGGNVLGPGDFFGVVSTMSAHSQIETARSLTEVSLIAVRRDQYSMLIEKNTPVAMKIIEGFSRRMRYLDEALAQRTYNSAAEASRDHLFYIGEYYLKQNQYNLAYYAYYQYLRLVPNGADAAKAKERLEKIKPYANPAHLETDEQQFNREYPKDTMIFAESMPGRELYIIQRGSVKITKVINDNEVLLAMLKAGDIFGEMALLENKPRSASAIAHEDAVLLAVNKENFGRMVTSQPQIVARLTTLLSERIWLIYKSLANTLIKNPVGRMYDALLNQLEKDHARIAQGVSYTFDFGPKELMKMVGLSNETGQTHLREFMQDKRFRIVDNRLLCSDVMELEKQAKYYRKMERINRARQERANA